MVTASVAAPPLPHPMARSLAMLCLLALAGLLHLEGALTPPHSERPRTAAIAPATGKRTPDPALRLEAIAEEGRIRLRWRWDGSDEKFDGSVLHRSTTPLDLPDLDVVVDPVTRLPVRLTSGEYADAVIADGVPYFYQLKLFHGKQAVYSNIVTVAIRGRTLEGARDPIIRVDKRNYVLEVAERDGTVLKRYPIALGRNPFRRKLHQDNASTPEGVYHIIGVQPKATFYRAYDIDYPNATDRLRYDRARTLKKLPLRNGGLPDIGGEIQIHGRGINSNWTFGCMALRNEDMDELFACPAITTGTPVLIYGHELSKAEVEGIWHKRGAR